VPCRAVEFSADRLWRAAIGISEAMKTAAAARNRKRVVRRVVMQELCVADRE